MGNIVFSQAAKFLKKRRNTRRWIAVVLCLALIVTSGTFGALTRHGSALTGAEQVLACTYENHVHGEECYNEAGELVCGYADYCVHVHNESCYDSEGNLVCPLPEIEAHVHDESCYVDEEQLICGMEENEIHQHTDDCYDIELGDLVCELEEHVHDDSCYELITEDEEIPENGTDADGENTQGEAPDGSEAPIQSETPATSEEPTENDNTAQSEAPAVSQTPAQSEAPAASQEPEQSEAPAVSAEPGQSGEPAASQTPEQSAEPSASGEAAQSEEPAEAVQSAEPAGDTETAQTGEAAESTEAQQGETPAESTESSDGGEINECAESRRLICGMEEHTHGNECYNQNKVLKCGKKEESVPHVHSDECYELKHVAKCGKLELHTHTEECYTDGVLTCGKLELKEHVHTEECFREAPVMELTATAGDATITVSANEEGIIPAGAELSVTPVVKTEADTLENLESEEERAEAEALNAVYDEIQQGLEASVEENDTKEIKHFLAYDISFHTQNENGETEEVKLNGDVNVTLEFPQGALPEEIISDENTQIESVDVLDVKATEEGRVAETQDAVVNTTQDTDVEKIETTLSDSSTLAIAWIGEINPDGQYVYEDDDVIITVSALDEGAIPENAKLKVVPIIASEETGEQYQQVAEKLMEKAENEEYAIAGFLAYDISFVDGEGNKIEPSGEVKVTMDYKEAKIPAEVDAATYAFASEEASKETGEDAASNAELNVKVMHLEEDAEGSVNVVDMAEQDKVTALETTDEQKIQNAEFVTGGFSVFTITWTIGSNGAEYVYEDDQVVITVTAVEPDAIPEGTKLQVIPVVPEKEETAEQYQQVAEKLVEQAENEVYDIAGFLAYDISFVDEAGNEVEPNGEVKVTMNYKEAKIPVEVDASTYAYASEDAPEGAGDGTEEEKVLNVTVMHLQEDEQGGINVVDMAKDDKVGTLNVTEEKEVQKAEFVTNSFSVFTITWIWDGKNPYVYEDEEVIITITPVDENSIPEGTKVSVTPIKEENEKTTEEYQKVEQKLQEAAESEEGSIAGFLAYDITLIDKEGNEIEPEGRVKVTMQYKKPTVPAAVEEIQSAADEMADENAELQEQAYEFEDGIGDTVAARIVPSDDGFILQIGDTDMNVTVKHLEENDDGEVAQVVDMSLPDENGASAVETLETTENQEVQKVEFVTDSFSTFTVEWSKNDGQNLAIIPAYYQDNELKKLNITVNEGSTKITTDENLLSNGGEYIPGEIYGLTDGETGYRFSKAVYQSDENQTADITSIVYSNNALTVEYEDDGSVASENQNDVASNGAVYFVYERDTLGTVQTIDSKAQGITLRLIDHVKSDNPAKVAFINTRGTTGSGANGLMDDGLWNRWENGKADWRNGRNKPMGVDGIDASSFGLVKSTLTNGYPELTHPGNPNKGTSLAELFSGGVEVNNLFREDIYNSSGYYEYDSSVNYAYKTDKQDKHGAYQFRVYDAVGTALKSSTAEAHCMGNFFPYDDIAAGYTSSCVDKKSGNKMYLAGYNNANVNYFFGMYMEASFIQPVGGLVSGEHMIYEFTGDDDLWLFVDDVLVLDLGGVHFGWSGTIDFATGDIKIKTTDGIERLAGNIREMYDAANASNKTQWREEEDGTFKTFADYTPHTLKMFYMERGAGASTLHIKMNIPPIPKGTIEVAKELKIEDEEKTNYKDLEFEFKVELEGITEESTYSVLTPAIINQLNRNVTDEEKKVSAKLMDTETGALIGDGNLTISADGTFKLKPGQKAQFTNLSENLNYKVTELNVNSNEYDHVEINGLEVTEADGTTTGINGWTTEPEQIYLRPRVTFLNDCSVQNERQLRITKEIEDMWTADADATFAFKVELGDLNESNQEELDPYTGSYYLYKENKDTGEKEYYAFVNGVLTQVDDPTAIELAKEGDDVGIIAGIPAGYTVEIRSILSGTIYQVQEVVQENGSWVPFEKDDNYIFKSITAVEKEMPTTTNSAAVVELSSDSGSSNQVKGTIQLSKDVEVTVTNQHSQKYVWELRKRSSNSTESTSLYLPGAEFMLSEASEEGVKIENGKVYIGASASEGNSTGVSEGSVVWKEIGSETLLTAIPEGTYLLEETKAPEGYMLSEAKWLVDVANNGVVTITANGVKVDGEQAEPDEDKETGITTNKTTFYFDNTPVYALPSTGGEGIYWYSIGGMLMMCAAVLILYRNKNKKVRGCRRA